MISDREFKNLVANDLQPSQVGFEKRLMTVHFQIFEQANQPVELSDQDSPKRKFISCGQVKILF